MLLVSQLSGDRTRSPHIIRVVPLLISTAANLHTCRYLSPCDLVGPEKFCSDGFRLSLLCRAALQRHITCCNGTRQGDLLSSESSPPGFLVNSKCRDNDGVSTGHVFAFSGTLTVAVRIFIVMASVCWFPLNLQTFEDGFQNEILNATPLNWQSKLPNTA